MYKVNDIFYSLQGEGLYAGRPAVFLRFAGCNLQCLKSEQGFDCDTNTFEHEKMNLSEIVAKISEKDRAGCRWVILTGGEPLLQTDRQLTDGLHGNGYKIAVETNGTCDFADGIGLSSMFDYVACSPKSGASIRLVKADECRIVLPFGKDPPKELPLVADNYYLSPPFDGLRVDEADLWWCVTRCLQDPRWSLSCQWHKLWGVK